MTSQPKLPRPRSAKPAYMTPNQFRGQMALLFGRDDWQGEASRLLDIERSTLQRLLTGRTPVSKQLALLVWALRELELEGIPFAGLTNFTVHA